MERSLILALALAIGVTPTLSRAAMQMQKAKVADLWKPAATPKGGVPWKLLESTSETQRKADGTIHSKLVFKPAVRALAGKQVKVAGWMMPLDTAVRQTRFVLLAYPPGRPFHFHAMPNQFIGGLTPAGVTRNERDPFITETLQLTG